MRGSVRRRGAGWEYMYREVDPFTGKGGKQRSKAGFPTRKAAQDALHQVLATMASGSYVSPTGITFGSFLQERWLPSIVATIRPSTHYSYSRNIRLHVLPTLGDVPLQRLEPSALNALYAQLLLDGRKDHRAGEPLSAKAVRYVHDVLNRALQDAFRWNLVTRNVARLATPPKPRAADRPELRTWTREDVAEFLSATKEHRLYAAFVVLATTGARRGEILGLRWSDVDLGAGRLHIRRSLICVTHEPQYSTTKTMRSRRAVAVDPATVAALRAHRVAQAAEKLAAGPEYDDSDLVFGDRYGHALHPERFTRTFQEQTERAGLPRIRLHDLRHTWATLALQAGVHPKVVSERLGHANISITIDTYSHVAPSMHAEAANTVAALFLQ
ncbi:MAG: tyrosine-type recombinase/integrase [Actinomycetes bacterium]